MQATEEVDDCSESLLSIIVSHPLKTLSQLFVCELGHISWSEYLLVHELLKGIIAGFLEEHRV